MDDVEFLPFQKINFVGIVIKNGSYQCIAIYKRVSQKISFTEREACSFFHALICAVAIIYNIRMKCVLRVQSILLQWDFTFINSFFVEQTCCAKFQSPDIRALDIHNAINIFHTRLLYAKDSDWICRILFSNMCNLG